MNALDEIQTMIRMLSIASAVALAASGAVHAQAKPDAYPTKAVRIIVGNTPGGGTDTVARLVAAQLKDRWKPGDIVAMGKKVV